MPYSEKFADLRLADRNTKNICGFAICGLNIKDCGFEFCGLAHLGNLRVEPTCICGFAICGL
jgi:hypothetical protein